MSPETQVHDFNPGITPSGLFWTIPVPDHAVAVDPKRHTARMHLTDVEVQDQGTIAAALAREPGVPALASFDVRWSGVLAVQPVRDTTNQFEAIFVLNTATAEWTAQEEGFAFVSDPADTSSSVFAEFGVERNGIFFR